MSNFETFSRDMAASIAAPHVTIHTRGAFSLNRAAFDMLGAPDAVDLLYDRLRDVVGMRAADPHSADSHAVRAASSAPAGPFMVTAMKFMRYYDIDLSATRRWDAYLEADTDAAPGHAPGLDTGPAPDPAFDVLCVDLRKPGTPVTSNRRGTGSNGAG